VRSFDAFLLGLILAGGAALRFHGIGAESLWLDEAAAVQFARGSLVNAVVQTALDVHPPFYYVVLHFWMLVAGTSEAAVRLLSTVIGLLTVIAIHRFGLAVFSRATALVAALLVAISPFQVQFAQEARMYTLLVLLGIWSMHASCLMLSGDASRRTRLACIVVTTMMLYTHVYAFFVLAAQVAYVAIERRSIAPEARWRWLAALATSAALFLPWLPVLIWQIWQVGGEFWMPPVTRETLMKLLAWHAGSRTLLWIAGPLALLGLWAAWRPRAAGAAGSGSADGSSSTVSPARAGLRPGPLLLLWFLCPIVLPILIAQVGPTIFAEKYSITASAAFLLLVARGIAALRPAPLGLAVIAAVGVLSREPFTAYFAAERKDNWRAATARLERRAEPGDLLLFHKPWGRVPFDYYARRTDLVTHVVPLKFETMTSDNAASLVARETSGYRRVWLVYTQPSGPSPLVPKILAESYKRTDTIEERGIEMYLFQK
jgi:mannosyltransferase